MSYVNILPNVDKVVVILPTSTAFSLSFAGVVFGTFGTSDVGLVGGGGGVLGCFSSGADMISTSLSVGERVSSAGTVITSS